MTNASCTAFPSSPAKRESLRLFTRSFIMHDWMHSCMCLITSARGESSSLRSLTSSISSATSRLSLSAGLPYSLILPSRLSTRIITYPLSSTTCWKVCNEKMCVEMESSVKLAMNWVKI
uniref:Uncharacterized protein n=1 Tax=Anopheles dirus TaxID=7168 RepID=A0A182NYI6_9DIPT